MALTIGDRAPEIALEDQDGVLRRRDELQDKVLVLFFYPKDDTPGCTAEACAFRDTYSSFEALGAAVWVFFALGACEVFFFYSFRRWAERCIGAGERTGGGGGGMDSVFFYPGR